MPDPMSVKGVMTILGMVTYTCNILPNFSSVTEPLRQLIKDSFKPGYCFMFEEQHKQSFADFMKMMSSTEVSQYYNPSIHVKISCGASSHGLEFVLLQNEKPVIYGSISLSKCEQAYGYIEKEMLAIVSACKKFHHFIYGRDNVTIETDHLPLIRIFDKPLYRLPLRLQKMKMRLQQYSFKIVHKPGTEIHVADGLSRFHSANIPDAECCVL